MLSKQLFGESCETFSGMVYRASRTLMEQKLIDAESLFLVQELEQKLGKAKPSDITEVRKQLERAGDAALDHLENMGSSLMEFGSDDASLVDPAIVLIYLVIVMMP